MDGIAGNYGLLFLDNTDKLYYIPTNTGQTGVINKDSPDSIPKGPGPNGYYKLLENCEIYGDNAYRSTSGCVEYQNLPTSTPGETLLQRLKTLSDNNNCDAFYHYGPNDESWGGARRTCFKKFPTNGNYNIPSNIPEVSQENNIVLFSDKDVEDGVNYSGDILCLNGSSDQPCKGYYISNSYTSDTGNTLQILSDNPTLTFIKNNVYDTTESDTTGNVCTLPSTLSSPYKYNTTLNIQGYTGPPNDIPDNLIQCNDANGYIPINDEPIQISCSDGIFTFSGGCISENVYNSNTDAYQDEWTSLQDTLMRGFNTWKEGSSTCDDSELNSDFKNVSNYYPLSSPELFTMGPPPGRTTGGIPPHVIGSEDIDDNIHDDHNIIYTPLSNGSDPDSSSYAINHGDPDFQYHRQFELSYKIEGNDPYNGEDKYLTFANRNNNHPTILNVSSIQPDGGGTGSLSVYGNLLSDPIDNSPLYSSYLPNFNPESPSADINATFCYEQTCKLPENISSPNFKPDYYSTWNVAPYSDNIGTDKKFSKRQLRTILTDEGFGKIGDCNDNGTWSCAGCENGPDGSVEQVSDTTYTTTDARTNILQHVNNAFSLNPHITDEMIDVSHYISSEPPCILPNLDYPNSSIDRVNYKAGQLITWGELACAPGYQRKTKPDCVSVRDEETTVYSWWHPDDNTVDVCIPDGTSNVNPQSCEGYQHCPDERSVNTSAFCASSPCTQTQVDIDRCCNPLHISDDAGGTCGDITCTSPNVKIKGPDVTYTEGNGQSTCCGPSVNKKCDETVKCQSGYSKIKSPTDEWVESDAECCGNITDTSYQCSSFGYEIGSWASPSCGPDSSPIPLNSCSASSPCNKDYCCKPKDSGWTHIAIGVGLSVLIGIIIYIYRDNITSIISSGGRGRGSGSVSGSESGSGSGDIV